MNLFTTSNRRILLTNLSQELKSNISIKLLKNIYIVSPVNVVLLFSSAIIRLIEILFKSQGKKRIRTYFS